MSQGTLTLAVIAVLILVVVTSRQSRRHSVRYTLYLRSPLWRLRRRLWILQAHGRCQDCGRWCGRRLTIHHLTYRRLGRESRQDIQVLCWPCHHGRHQAPPMRGRPVRPGSGKHGGMQ
jgi:5-methylcytosine-specific restriction endonuclease McrA